ncbi:MAG TPA: DegT/DnrJ/EryC1/StrS family aminotransferase [Prolixibacteraceae bacterium]|jgi:dTDP-4-amino-4,6-dideoxygalactose transaminase|nr:DegT/DnrJ/EryC1/StrS family aminotransferase [Prolixibacteraceae bacterium]HOR99799.1 DegT/DnrJ/EryC1/StrS family aminotransferase [Prolixibacteraceae bacterium]HOS89689.1 DegT/DnrJ/EryC1/StrS family aminotransferase [Prolixibacteraceae bacterium]HPL44691.1 DegT/DnrJ/EryC1/StrS family aminotransferase [Prolixibacteraceae bacterium]HQE51390.1 DegT/DnrJ/EryC1/StrS family aminotransferase [Prolixibacteraceae bacterium]
MPEDKPIYVTQPALPPLDEFVASLEIIWNNRILTNNGPFHCQFEKELADYLGVKYISLFSNGTLALVTALQALKITGEVITTPYSFVASTHALWWNNIKPVFVDIEPATCNLDPEKIEAAITPLTTAILPVHVYGNPCNVYRIKEIGDTYGLKVIYDACHTFGVTINNEPLLSYGDLSVMSFHATKVFNTFEGGAIVCHDETMKKRIDYLKNFGFAGETTVVAPGINAKMNEVQAALGLLQLKRVDEYIEKRKQIVEFYRENLKGIHGLSVMKDMEGVRHCYPYFPVFVEEEVFGMSRDALYERLKQHNIFGRRYFYPLISQFPTYRGLESAQPGKMPVAEKITEQVICLPLFPDLDKTTIEKLVNLIL